MQDHATSTTLVRRPVAAFAATVIALPVVLVAVLLWHAFTSQIDESYGARLKTSLSVLELGLERRLDDFRNAMARLSVDNTLQVTVDLDIRPQLARYLKSQFDVSEFDFLAVVGLNNEVLATVGDNRDLEINCQLSRQQTSGELLASHDGKLLLIRTQKLSARDRPLAYLCAGQALNGADAVESIARRIDGTAALGWQGRVLAFGGQPTVSVLDERNSGVFATELDGDQYRNLSRPMVLGEKRVILNVALHMQDYKTVMQRSLWIIGLVLLFVLTLSGFGLKMLGQRRQAEHDLSREREKAVVTLASIADGVVTTDDSGRITYVNPAAELLLEASAKELDGLPWHDAFDLRSETSDERILDLNAMKFRFDSDAKSDAVLVGRHGGKTAVHFSVAQINESESVDGTVITFRDVHRERDLSRRLQWKACRDDLTGLLNRSEFRRQLGSIIGGTIDPKTQHCLLYIDLDEFKVVNDTCGHKAGDDLLRQVSAALLSQLRDADTVSRLGGDEFGVLLNNCPRERGITLAKGLIELINDKRFHFQDKVFHIGASIGLVSVNHKTRNLEDLLAAVDAACYAAKEQGRNRVAVGEIDSAKILHRMEELRQASHIRQALKDDRLRLFRQSIVLTDVPNPDQEVHAEILVRMVDESGELVVPGAFIPIAERHGLMQAIDRWIIHHLLSIEGDRLRQWRAPDANAFQTRISPSFVYGINLSGASLTDPTFLDFVKQELTDNHIPGGSIAFEITETQVITHLDKAVALITELKDLGCKFLLDDFGSGMSSFGYLKHLPVDYLKIDGQFVKDILTDPIDRSMVKMINEIGHIMGLKTIAEFVENDDILEEISAIGVDMAQGYGIARPVPLMSERRDLVRAGVGL